MPRLLPLLLLCLTLLAACKKEAVEPPLEGRWTYASQKTLAYWKTGALHAQTDNFHPPFYMVITSTERTNYDAATQAVKYSLQIKREGATIRDLTSNQLDLTIAELTEHTLTLHTDKLPPSLNGVGSAADYDIIETKFTR